MIRRRDSFDAAMADIRRAMDAVLVDVALRIAEDAGRGAEAAAADAGVAVAPLPERPDLTPELHARMEGVMVGTLVAGPMSTVIGGMLGRALETRRGRLGRLKRQLEVDVAATTDPARLASLDAEQKVRLLLSLEALRTLLDGMRNGDGRRRELVTLRDRYENFLSASPPSYVQPTIDRALAAIDESVARP